MKIFARSSSIFLTLLVAASLLGGFIMTQGMQADSSSRMLSYIVQGVDAIQVAQVVEQHGGVVTSVLELIHGVGAQLPASAVAELQAEPAITAITANGTVVAVGANPTPKGGKDDWPATDYPDVVGADFTWQEGVSGEGVTVAVVDTGLSYHPFFFRDPGGKLPPRLVGWQDFVDRSKQPVDPNGHGTHIAGVIANAHIGSDGEWNGVAPGANLVAVRVLDRKGYGTYESVLQGIQWVVANREKYNIRVLNLSIVAPVLSPYWADPLNQAAMEAWAAGIVVVAAAGNSGPGPFSISVPGNNPYLITVGAFTDHYTPYDWSDDYLTPFSAAGPTLDGFVKPDLVAPGGHIVSTMMPSSYLVQQHQANKVDAFYFSMAGTSQSAAVVSGVAALVCAQHPHLTPDEVKFRLLATAFPWVDLETTDALYSMWQQGAGRVSAPDAVFADISGTANHGMDIRADLAGEVHYEGYSHYDEQAGEFRLRGGYGNWSGGYGNWSGGYGKWSGGYGNWSGGYGNWSGGYGNWSGGYGNWSGGYGNWSGGYGNWSGGYGNWSGGYGNWSGGFGNWSGGFGNWSGGFGNWSGGFGNWSGSFNLTGSVSMTEWVDEQP
jgi:serine protease AprX